MAKTYIPYPQEKKQGFYVSTEQKVIGAIVLVTVVIMAGGIFLISKQNEQLSKPLLGQTVEITGRSHLTQGTDIQYNSNPPAAGDHYPIPAHAGVYDTPPPDGNLVHSLEHGAVILWYKSDLPKNQVDKLQQIYYSVGIGKKIMVPRKSLDVLVALSSWGQVLKLRSIDEAKIKVFFETNAGRGMENAPI